ncbi:hypothetical protein N0V95_009127, partial [Ascochyta clinopodiicola]
MAPMVRLGIRPGAPALRAAAGRGECALRPSIRALQSRCIATGAAVQQPGVEFPGNAPSAHIPPVQTPSRQSAKDRIQAIENVKPFSEFLTDNFQRQHDYLRISITERCNLRCLYCMPEEGIPLSPPATMLTTPEIFYLSSLFVSQGVTKIRLTGGEPTVRRDIVPLMQQIGSLRPKGLRELALTTNGISLHRKLDAMVEAGLTAVNLSLDTLDPFQFQIMTRRKGFDAVMKSIDRILEMNKLGANIKLKVNCVVMRGLNEREILPFVEMGREKDIEVRFIEYMPFGGNKWSENKMISFQEMVDIIRTKYPGLARIPGHKNDTSKTFQVPGFVGKVGFITSMTNDFCSSCNRLRITSDGNLKVCLHGNDEVSLRDLLRKDNSNEPIDQEAFERIKQIEMDRHEGRLSDDTALGWGQRERELLSVIGQAVKRKAEKHADMGDLANMQNRPMILIGQQEHLRTGFGNGQAVRPSQSARTASGILATSAFLNPLLGSTPNTARAFSTSPIRHANEHTKKVTLADHDSVEDEGDVAPIERIHHDYVLAKERRRQSGEGWVSREARLQRKKDQVNQTQKPRTNTGRQPTVQVDEKSRLLQELTPDWKPSSDVSQKGAGAVGGPTVKQLAARLTKLKARLATAQAHDWSVELKLAQESQSSSEMAGQRAKTIPKGIRQHWHRMVTAKFENTIKEIKANKKKHEEDMAELKAAILVMNFRITNEKAKGVDQVQKSEAADATSRARSSGREERLEEIKRKKEELLRRKDLLAVEMARLQAGKQRATSVEERRKAQQKAATSPTDAQKQKPQRSPSTDTIQAKPLDTKALRLHLPRGRLTIDKNLTIDINAPAASLRSQISALQNRLKSFYPRLDSLPFDINKSSTENKQYLLKTWLKILVSRFQAKTGVGPSAADEQLQRVLTQTVSDNGLSKEAAERMAKRWNSVFANRRGRTVTAADVQRAQEKNIEEDYNEMGFLEDEYAIEEELLAGQNEPPAPAQASSTQPRNTPSVSSRDRDSAFDISDEDYNAFVTTFTEEAKAAKPSTSHRSGNPNSNTDAEAVENEEVHTGKAAAREQQASSPDSQEPDIDVLKHNLQARKLGWGDDSDIKGSSQGVPTSSLSS